MSAPNTNGIYIASKTKHAERWRYLRDVLGLPIISTWIDEAGIGETDDFDDLWERCLTEASSADVLILYREPGEVLKGAMAELGAAMSHNKPAFVIGISDQSIAKYRLATTCETIMEAIERSASIYGFDQHKSWTADQIARFDIMPPPQHPPHVQKFIDALSDVDHSTAG